MKIEACVETLSDAQIAIENGAHRLELCSELRLDGLSPSMNLILNCQQMTDVPLAIMLRFKSDNFFHTDTDIERIQSYADECIAAGIRHFVFGALTENNGRVELDLHNIKKIASHVYPAILTVHKAIDLCTDIFEAVQRLETISNVQYILSSGTMDTAWNGRDILRKLSNHSTVKIIAAGKITSRNLSKHQAYIGAEWYHGRKIVSGLD